MSVITEGKDAKRINTTLLQGHIGKPAGHIFYIAGTLGFVTALREIVLALGTNDDDIRTDEFPGY